MKKIVALLLSVLMLLGMAAIAEEGADTALVTCVSNIAFEQTANGTTDTKSLDGFEAYISLDTADGLALVAQAFNGDESLLFALAKIVGSQFQLGIEGLDKTFVADVPQLAGQDTSALGETVRPALPAILNLELPMIDVVSLPKMDLKPFASMFGTEAADGSVSFSIPAEMIDSLLDQVIEAAKSSGESIQGLDQVIEGVEQLRAAGMSIALEGIVADTGSQQTANISVYVVNNGQMPEEPALVLNIASAQDTFNLTVDMINGGETMTVGTLEILTDVGSNSFTATLDIAGMMQFDLAAYQESGMQRTALNMESMFGANFALTLSYGKTGDENVCELTFATGDGTAMTLTTNMKAENEAYKSGTLDLAFATADSALHLTANIDQFIGEVDMGNYTLPEDTASMEEIESDENSEALQTALMPLISYFGQALAD